MPAEQQPPLTYQASADSSSPHMSASMPPEVVTCLKNARFLHLATCDDRNPHISLMNYTYLSHSPTAPYPIIVMSTNPSSKKTLNLLANPRVSLLVHDWVSHRPPTRPVGTRDGTPPPASRSSLATMLLNMNTSALSRISATINGDARIVEQGSDEERWLKERHLENNTFGDQLDPNEVFGTSPVNAFGDGGRGRFIEDEDVRVVVVKISDGRIADWKGGVQDWAITGGTEDEANGIPIVNGV